MSRNRTINRLLSLSDDVTKQKKNISIIQPTDVLVDVHACNTTAILITGAYACSNGS